MIDREQIVNTIFMGKFAQPLYSMVPIGFLGHKDSFKDRYGSKPNIDAARKLLREAGYSEANPLSARSMVGSPWLKASLTGRSQWYRPGSSY